MKYLITIKHLEYGIEVQTIAHNEYSAQREVRAIGWHLTESQWDKLANYYINGNGNGGIQGYTDERRDGYIYDIQVGDFFIAKQVEV